MNRATLYEVIKSLLMETSMLSMSLQESSKGDPQKLKRAVNFISNEAVDSTKMILDLMEDYKIETTKREDKMWQAKAKY